MKKKPWRNISEKNFLQKQKTFDKKKHWKLTDLCKKRPLLEKKTLGQIRNSLKKLPHKKTQHMFFLKPCKNLTSSIKRQNLFKKNEPKPQRKKLEKNGTPLIKN